jgi:hypothetical protein
MNLVLSDRKISSRISAPLDFCARTVVAIELKIAVLGCSLSGTFIDREIVERAFREMPMCPLSCLLYRSS